MSWRPAALGALVVILAGLAVGVLIGGKERERTTTVVRTVTQTERADPRPTTQPGTAESTAPSREPDERYLVDLPEPQTPGDNASAEEGNAKVGRDSYPSSMVIHIFDSNQDDPAVVEFTVAPGVSRFRGTLGFDPDSPSRAKATLEVRKDRERGEVLYRRDFSGPADFARNAEFDLEGAVKAVFVWTTEPSDDYEFPGYESEFVLGNARFVP